MVVLVRIGYSFVPSTYFERPIERSLLAFARTSSDSFSLARA